MKTKRGFLLIIIGVLALILFPYITSCFAVELREISAIIAETILRIAGMSIERAGTILTLDKLIFDIIPACNGSTTLTVLFITGLLLVVGSSKLNLPRKFIYLLLIIPIALLANGMRLALLVYASYVKGMIIAEGALHNAIGVLTFMLALTALLAIMELLIVVNNQSDSSQREHELFILAIILICVSFFPFFSACIRDWLGTEYNRNDMLGFIFFIPGLIFYIYFWVHAPRNRKYIKIATFIIAGTLLFATIFQLLNQNNYVFGISLIIIMFCIALMEKGWLYSLIITPSLLIIILSYSKVSETMNQILSTEGFTIPFIIKIIIMSSLSMFLLYIYKSKYFKSLHLAMDYKKNEQSFLRYYTTIAIVSLCSVFFSIQGYTTIESENIYSYQLDYLMGNWIGYEIKDIKAENYYSKKKLISRFYKNKDQVVGLMVVPSNGKSRNIHTPEYCQQGLGWIIDKSMSIKFINYDKQEISAKKLLMHRKEDGVERTFIYWFDDGNFSTGTYLSFILKNSIQRLLGERKNWILYIVWSDNVKDEDGLNNFLAHLKKVKIINKAKKASSVIVMNQAINLFN